MNRYENYALNEQKLIRKFFKNKTNGTCIEVGSNEPVDYRSQSNHLEKKLNWNCYLIEPNIDLVRKTKLLRPKAKVINCACVQPELDQKYLKLFIPKTSSGVEVHGHASVQKNIDEHNYSFFTELRVKGQTLDSIINKFQLNEIDLLSIDVEGYELEVLNGIDLTLNRPRLILLEDKHLFLTKHNLLKKNNYTLVQRINRNCWYVANEIEKPKVTFFSKIRLYKRIYISLWFNKIKYSIRHKTISPFLRL